MSDQGGPTGPGGQQSGADRQPGPDPQGQQGGQPGQQGWQQGPQHGQQGPPPAGGQQPWQPAGQQGWQQPAPPNWQQPGQPTGPQGWQQPGPATAPWQGQPANTQGQPPGYPQGQQPQGYPPAGYQPQGQPMQGATPYSQGEPWTGQQPPAATKSRKPIIITAIAVVVALVAAVGVYFLAIRQTNTTTADGGNGTPQQAVESLFTTLGDSDPIGVADQLDPAESALFTDLNSDVITELKRLDVLSDAASADSMTGSTISVSGVTYDPTEETINDNLHIVKLTGGTITVASDPAKIPLSQTMKDAFGSEIDEVQPQSQTVDIADAVKDNDGEPIRIATVQRDGKWYVSLFYSIADNATHAAGLPNPTAADRIDPKGYPSAEEAASALVDSASTGDLETIIAMLPPDEMAVMHDYGRLILEQSDASSLTDELDSAGVSVSDVTWATSEVTGGTKVSIAGATITADGQTVTMTRNVDEGSISITVPGQPEITLDENSIDTYIEQAAGEENLDPQLVELIKREFKQVIGLGIVTTKVGDSWYVSPIRSFSDIFVSLLKGMEPEDVQYLISLAQN